MKLVKWSPTCQHPGPSLTNPPISGKYAVISTVQKVILRVCFIVIVTNFIKLELQIDLEIKYNYIKYLYWIHAQKNNNYISTHFIHSQMINP